MATQGQIVYEFGKQWASYSRMLDERKLEAAKQSLQKLLGTETLYGKSFLDIGCGSGVFLIAASQLGAKRLVGIDVDPLAVQVSDENVRRWLDDPGNISVQNISVLDEKKMASLGAFDVVYAWGSLHHTGEMRRALEIASRSVKSGGRFIISIYNRHFSSPSWKVIKRFYNLLPPIARRLMVWAFVPVILLAKWVVTLNNPLRKGRGMTFMIDVLDWLGGYPYEYASMEEMNRLLSQLGFAVERNFPAEVPTGCNEFVCTLP
jgi:2-polyprenyl-6-hydroxyphenyl methylase/3-demethylubiquinone-9 3-methyltransferase